MTWNMEVEEVEGTLEKIWDLHDRISDAIHAVSRAHFLNSVRAADAGVRGLDEKKYPKARFGGGGGDDGKDGYVFVKGFKLEEDASAVADVRSLNGIRTALEDLEDQIEFFHTVQSQQQTERDAVIARLEQSRILLAMRLSNHHGKKYKVIEEALAFVGDVSDDGCFISPEYLFQSQPCDNLSVNREKRSTSLMDMLVSNITLAKRSLRLDKFGEILGNATLFAVSMLVLLQLNRVAISKEQSLCRGGDEDYNSDLGSTSRGDHVDKLDVWAARG